MNRETESAFQAFCTRQYQQFEPSQWLDYSGLPKGLLATAAYFLACLPWYGRSKELLAVVEKLRPDMRGNFAAAVAEWKFDSGRFSNRLRRRLGSLES